MKILCFTWNTQSMRICESLNDDIIQMNRKNNGFWSMFQGNCYGSCIKADFLPELMRIIKDEECDIVCVSFQEDAYPGSYFHSDLLKSQMSSNGYILMKRAKLMGIGKTSYQGIKSGEIVARGLRCSVYCKNDLAIQMKQFEISLFPNKKFEDYDQETYSHSVYRNKGATCITIYHPDLGSIAFINCHFPFTAKRLIDYSENKDIVMMQERIHEQNHFYNEIYRKFILDKNPDYVYWMGDFNYRVNIIPKPEEGLTLSDLKFKTSSVVFDEQKEEFWKVLYENNDELLTQMKKQLIYPMKEGIGKQGPLFPPTCKLEKSETRGYKMGKNKHRYPSWCDRILYKGNTKNISYYSWDYGNMKHSDHSSVIGIFTIEE